MFEEAPRMSEPEKTESKEEGFVSHLVELRDRLVRAGGAIIVVFLGLVCYGLALVLHISLLPDL